MAATALAERFKDDSQRSLEDLLWLRRTFTAGRVHDLRQGRERDWSQALTMKGRLRQLACTPASATTFAYAWEI